MQRSSPASPPCALSVSQVAGPSIPLRWYTNGLPVKESRLDTKKINPQYSSGVRQVLLMHPEYRSLHFALQGQ